MCFQRDMKVFNWLCNINVLALYVVFKLEFIKFYKRRPPTKKNRNKKHIKLTDCNMFFNISFLICNKINN